MSEDLKITSNLPMFFSTKIWAKREGLEREMPLLSLIFQAVGC